MCNEMNNEEILHRKGIKMPDISSYKIVKNAFYKKDVLNDVIVCQVCNSKNIHILKGDGHKIIGDDLIAIICNNCKKVYEFIDVIYKK